MASVLFLGGLGRSGTTLLERTLGELPGVVALGEVVHLWQRDVRDNERCACGTAFHDCPFWAKVGAAAFDGWAGVDVDRIRALRDAVERTRHIPALAGRRLPARRRGDVLAYGAYYAAVYRAAAEVAGARVVVDSSKHSALAHCLRWMRPGAIDLRVVQVVRDPRGVAYSWTRTVARPEADDAEMTRYAPARSALLWTAHNAALGLLARRDVPVTRVRYERFLADPVATVAALADFAGLPLGPGDLDFLGPAHVDLGVGHSAAGNPMRFAVGRVALRADDAWRRALPVTDRYLVSALCAPLLRRYGYPLLPSPARTAAVGPPRARHRRDARPAAQPVAAAAPPAAQAGPHTAVTRPAGHDARPTTADARPARHTAPPRTPDAGSGALEAGSATPDAAPAGDRPGNPRVAP